MKHEMTLFSAPYESTKSGHKHIEVRLNDEKRRKIKIGDIIEYIKLPERQEKIEVIVEELYPFDNIKQIYDSIVFKEFDCEGWTMEEMIEGTYEIYTSEQEQMWGSSWDQNNGFM